MNSVSPQVSLTSNTIAARPAARPAAPQPQPPQSAVAHDVATIGAPPRLSAMGKLLDATGKGLGKLDLFGGAAVGGILGYGASVALGHVSWLLPLVGAGLFGFEAADAHAAEVALQQGKSSPAFQDRIKHSRSKTSCSAASVMLALGGSSAAFGLGYGLLGGTAGLAAGLVGATVVAGAVVFSSAKAEKAILQSAA